MRYSFLTAALVGGITVFAPAVSAAAKPTQPADEITPITWTQGTPTTFITVTKAAAFTSTQSTPSAQPTGRPCGEFPYPGFNHGHGHAVDLEHLRPVHTGTGSSSSARPTGHPRLHPPGSPHPHPPFLPPSHHNGSHDRKIFEPFGHRNGSHPHNGTHGHPGFHLPPHHRNGTQSRPTSDQRYQPGYVPAPIPTEAGEPTLPEKLNLPGSSDEFWELSNMYGFLGPDGKWYTWEEVAAMPSVKKFLPGFGRPITQDIFPPHYTLSTVRGSTTMTSSPVATASPIDPATTSETSGTVSAVEAEPTLVVTGEDWTSFLSEHPEASEWLVPRDELDNFGKPTPTSAVADTASPSAPTITAAPSMVNNLVARNVAYNKNPISLFPPGALSQVSIKVTKSTARPTATSTPTPTVPSNSPATTAPQPPNQEKEKVELAPYQWPQAEGLKNGTKLQVNGEDCTIEDGMAIRDSDNSVMGRDGTVYGVYDTSN